MEPVKPLKHKISKYYNTRVVKGEHSYENATTGIKSKFYLHSILCFQYIWKGIISKKKI